MNRNRAEIVQILHVHSRFPGGTSAQRSLAVARGLGADFEHALVLVESGEGRAIPGPFRLVADFPRLSGLPTLGRLQRLAKAMLSYDLVCTYDYGAIDAVMAHTAFSRAFAIPPLIHHESEDATRGRRADWYRRVALGKSSGLVVPDERIEAAALEDWQQPMGRVKDIPLGIELRPWQTSPPADFMPRLLKRPGEKWVGLVTDFEPLESLQTFLDGFVQLTENWHLVAFGEFGRSRAFRDHAERLEIAHRVHVPGPLAEDGRAIGLFDLAVFPDTHCGGALNAIRAMAAGVPILADPSSFAAPLVPEKGREFVVDFLDGEEIAYALGTLAADEQLRKAMGEANHAQAKERHDEKDMIDTHRRLYTSAIGLKQR